MKRNFLSLFTIVFVGLFLSRDRGHAAKSVTAPLSQTHEITLGQYMQNRHDDQVSDQSVDLSLASTFTFQDQLKATSYFYYYYSYIDPSHSDWDDPIFTLTTLPRPVGRAMKMRFYTISSVAVSKYSRDVLKQYATLGFGTGVSLDTKYLKIPAFNLGGTMSASKNFVETSQTKDGYSNNNFYMAYGATGSYSYAKWTFEVHFMFYQYFKLVNDESTETLYQYQDLGYQFAPNHSIGVGHSNRMGFYDDNSGAPNFRVVNGSSSYFYLRYTYSI